MTEPWRRSRKAGVNRFGAKFGCMRRRRVLLLALAALAATGAARAAPPRKVGGVSYIAFPTLTATVVKSDGRRGVFTLEAGVDVPNAALRARVSLLLPRLRAAYVQTLQTYVYSLQPGAPADPDFLATALQRQTDRVLGQPGARLLLGAMMVN